MLYLIECNNGRFYNEVEANIIISLIKSSRGLHEYIEVANDEWIKDNDEFGFDDIILKRKEDFPDEWSDAVPIGNIAFVEKFLTIFRGIEHENAIEVPPVLRQEKFLKRKYSIVPVWDIPKEGYYFLKDATQQKIFHYNGELANFICDEMFEEPSSKFDKSIHFDYEHLYQVSESVNVLAEYRVYVINGQVEQVCQFAGDPLLFPDATLIGEAVELYSAEADCLKSYSMDLMITPRGTAISEVHSFFSLGLYSTVWGDNLLGAYRDALDWVTNYNTKQIEYISD